MKQFVSLFAILLISVAGCSSNPSTQTNSVQNQEKETKAESVAVSTGSTNSAGFQSFLVYGDKGSRNNHYTPSGFMPDGKCLTFDDAWKETCQGGSTCIKVVYDVACSREGQKWGGVYWLNPPNNWGGQKGGFDLTGSEKLTFWAKGEKGGERIEEFKIGGITGEYPDTDTAVIGPVILTPEWKQYTIDLRGKDLSYMSGGFAWATNVDVNPNDCTFYLDEIQYE